MNISNKDCLDKARLIFLSIKILEEEGEFTEQELKEIIITYIKGLTINYDLGFEKRKKYGLIGPEHFGTDAWWACIVRQEWCSEAFRLIAVTHPYNFVRDGVARYTKDNKILNLLKNDKNSWVSEEVRKNEHFKDIDI